MLYLRLAATLLLPSAFAATCHAPDGALPQPGAPAIAFVNAHVVPMTSDVVLPARTVVVQGERIVEVGPSEAVRLPAGTRTIDASGKYLMPGLVDSHVHLRAETELDAYARYGVTTVVAPRGTEAVLALRDRVRSGALDGPRIFTAGPLLDGDPPIFPGGATRVVTGAAEAGEAVEAHCRAGYEFVKTYNNLLPERLREIVAGAHACGLPVIAHLPRRPVREDGLRAALAAGVDVIAHGEEIFFTHLRGASDARLAQPDAAVSEDDIDTAVRAIREAGTYVTPNLSFIAMTARLLDDAEALFADPEFARLAPDVQQLWRNQHPGRRPDVEAFKRRELVKRAAVVALTARLQSAGVPLLLGTDASAPGLFPGRAAHLELEELVASGLTPFQAIATGTRTPGRFFAERVRRISGPPLGIIERGAAADLVLLGADPLADVRHMALIEGIMLRGRWRPVNGP
jgi:imidazolonepropionase-like amidohydrolase